MGVQQGNRPITGGDIDMAEKLLIEGFSMLEGWVLTCGDLV